tara:strand:- start:12583 stop:13239 length:657 start_codon:yes stop_codon:yes gene_type:complete
MKKIALILAGGKGVRMNNILPKQFLIFNQLPLLMHTMRKFSSFDKIILVLPENHLELWNSLCEKYKFNITHEIVVGGKTRFHSVRKGLEKITENCFVAIHDGVRPLVSDDLINRLINKCKIGFGVIPVLSIKDSLRKFDKNHSKIVNREGIKRVQTPQCFYSEDIIHAYKQKYTNLFTDDSSVFQSDGGELICIDGEEKNLKITNKDDLIFAINFIKK